MIWKLLVIMQFKHFIADYPLQTPYMLGKFKDKGWVLPLASHCACQAIFTWIITFFATNNFQLSFLLSLLDFFIHFIMDRIKASPKLLGRYESLSKDQFKGLMESHALALKGTTYPKNVGLQKESKRLVKEIEEKFKSNKYFWWALGIDQMVHHLTDILIIFLIMGNI